MGKSLIIISIDAKKKKKAFSKIQYPVMVKAVYKLGIEDLVKMNKYHLQKQNKTTS